MQFIITTSLLFLAGLCRHTTASPVPAESLPVSESMEQDSPDEGKLFVPSLEEHEVHLKAMLGDDYTPETLARDSLANPQFSADREFTEDEMEFLGDGEDIEILDVVDNDDGWMDDLDDEDIDIINGTSLVERQAPCGQWSSATRPAADRRPRPDFFHKQLTHKINCGPGGGCGTSRTSSKSFSFGWSADVAARWISAGFNVGKSVTTGNGYSCTAPAGGSVCLWKHVMHTSYRVVNGRHNSCTGFEVTTSPFRMRSPNKNHPRTNFYCVRGDACRGRGDGYWQTNV